MSGKFRVRLGKVETEMAAYAAIPMHTCICKRARLKLLENRTIVCLDCGGRSTLARWANAELPSDTLPAPGEVWKEPVGDVCCG